MHTTARFPSRPARRGIFVEHVEARLLFHVSAPVVPIADLSRPENAQAETIDLSQSFADPANAATRVAFGFDLGRVVVELFNSAAPLTVANFLNYTRSDRYDDTVVHRSANLGAPNFEPFVIQGGGFRASDLTHIATDAPVTNEFRPNTEQRGTIAMAKQGGNPNSATSEWFFNLRDNKDILDGQNGGFTSFGQVITGMNVVDAISALPTITQPAPAPFTSLSDFPVENNPPAPPQDYVNVDYIAELPKLTGTVTSSNPAVVTAAVSGTSLNLSYVPGAVGTSVITVNATDRTGAPVTEAFTVRVGFVDVPVGSGVAARKVTYTDADGTVGVITFNGGTGTVSVGGTGLTQTPAGNNITIGGTGISVDRINVTGGTPTISVKTKGGDGHVVINGINGGAVRSFSGPGVILQGTSDIASGIGRLDLFQAQGATLNLGASPDGSLSPSITLGSAVDTNLTSAAAIKSLRFNTWTSTDATPETITAPSVNSFQAGGDFSGNLTLTGAGNATNLSSARVNGAASGTWVVPGIVRTVSLGSTTSTFLGTLSGPVGTLAVAGDLAGTVNAGNIRNLRAASMTGATVNLAQGNGAGMFALNSLNVKGAITNTNIRATSSDINFVTAGSITNSTIYAGINPADGAALPAAAGDFVAPTTIRAVTIRNHTSASFVDSDIAAGTLGRLNLGVINTANGGVPFGLAAHTVLAVTAADSAGAKIRYANLKAPADTKTSGDFVARVV